MRFFFRIRHPFLSKCLLRMRKRRKWNLIRIFLWRTKPPEAVCKHDWHNVRSYLFFYVRKCRTRISDSVCKDLKGNCTLIPKFLHVEKKKRPHCLQNFRPSLKKFGLGSIFRISSKHFERCFDNSEPLYKRTPKSRMAIVKFIYFISQHEDPCTLISQKLVVFFLICGSSIASKASNWATDILK